MQTSGFAVIPNALASLIVPYQIPAIMFVSERGTLGEFNIGQVMVSRLLRPTLDTLGVAHHTLTDETNMRFILDSSIKQAVTTQSPVVFILSPLLTGGNPAAHGNLSS
jgi:sulfopyruvate decarboxylase TPP-binding subunit